MALISDYKKKADSKYGTVFGTDSEVSGMLADLITAAHSTKIKNGNELEDILQETSRYEKKCYGNKKINEKIRKEIAELKETAVITKLKVPTGHKKDGKNEVAAIDNIKVLPSEKMIFLTEIKDGDNFDTKKVKGEEEKLERAVAKAQKLFPGWKVEPRFILFCRKEGDRSSIPSDFSALYKTNGWILDGDTGAAFLGTSRAKVDLSRSTDQEQNVECAANICLRIVEAAGLSAPKAEEVVQ